MTVKVVPERAGLTAAQTRDIHYEHDNRGLQTKARFDSLAGEGITNVYDGFGRVVSSTLAMGGTSRSITSEYDLNGNRTRITYPMGVIPPYAPSSWSYRYVYDGADRLVASTYPAGQALAGWQYDQQGRPQTLTRYGVPLTTLGYDPASRLETLTHDLPAPGSDVSFGFAYNSASQVATKSVSNDSYASSSAYDVVRPYAANGLNQYISAGPAAFAYDLNGNLTSDGSSTFVYDVENRLVSASGAKTASLIYDPLGRLWQTSGGSAGVTQFAYDGDKLLMEFDGAGVTLRGYVHGVAQDTPVVWFEGPQPGRILVTDHQGSIVATVKRLGADLAINGYDAWGIPNAGNVGRFGYTGQAWIPELGLWYYKARFYSPTVGRFLQVDPVGYDDQMNLYVYVGNDPLNGTDPSGQYECKTDADCRTAAKGISEIRAAQNYHRSAAIGSLVPRNLPAAQIIGKILLSLGTKGDGGVNIRSGDLPGATGGEFDKANNTITLDTARIDKSGGRVGEVLGHEAQHYRQKDQNLSPLAEEARPLLAQYLIGTAPGGSIKGIAGGDYVRQRLNWDYCKLPDTYCNPAIDRVMNVEMRKPF